jgi:hypothetical protein
MAFDQKLWVRVWRGQGHDTTIGWALYTGFRTMRLGSLDQDGCSREGRPGMTPSVFLEHYLLRKAVSAKPAHFSESGRFYREKKKRDAVTVNTIVYEIRFQFRAHKY